MARMQSLRDKLLQAGVVSQEQVDQSRARAEAEKQARQQKRHAPPPPRPRVESEKDRERRLNRELAERQKAIRGHCDGTEIVENSDNVLLIRTFSKMHGLAGLRVGWGYGPATVIEAVNAIRGAFNVSLPAQVTAVAALSDAEHEEATFAHNAQWLPWLSRELERVGLRVYPSVCNFVLARVPTDPSLGTQAVVDHLAHRGILVKTVTEYGLSDCLRITIGREEENKALVIALAEILG